MDGTSAGEPFLLAYNESFDWKNSSLLDLLAFFMVLHVVLDLTT